MAPCIICGMELAVQLSQGRHQQIGYLSPNLRAERGLAAGELIYRDNNCHVAKFHSRSPQYSSGSRIVVAERSASVMIIMRSSLDT